MTGRREDPGRIADLLEKIAFFQEFSAEERMALAHLDGQILHYTKGDFIICQGEVSSELYVLLQGKVCITKKETPQAELNVLEPGSIFGEAPLITGSPRLTNAVAGSKVMVLRIDKDLLKSIEPGILNKFYRELLKILIKRLDEMNTAMAGLKGEFDNFIDAYEHVRSGIDKIMAATTDLKLVQNLSYSYFSKLRQ